MTLALRAAPVLALLAGLGVLVTLLVGEERRARRAAARNSPKGPTR